MQLSRWRRDGLPVWRLTCRMWLRQSERRGLFLSIGLSVQRQEREVWVADLVELPCCWEELMIVFIDQRINYKRKPTFRRATVLTIQQPILIWPFSSRNLKYHYQDLLCSAYTHKNLLVRMRTIFYIAFLHQCWSAFAHNGPAVPGPFRAPGRLDRMMPRQPGRDCGSYTLNCQGAEGACNNACYHINCNINSGPNRDRVTYIGPGADAENSRNRQQSGCAASPCGNYPFSQKFRDPNLNTPNVHCDEWPMAASIQNNFVAGTLRNSLRCISGSENTCKLPNSPPWILPLQKGAISEVLDSRHSQTYYL